MKFKYNIHYIVTKGSDDGEIKVGERLWLEHYVKVDKYHGFEHFTIITPARPDDKPLLGLPPINHTWVYRLEQEMLDALKGVEVELNVEIAQKMINDHLNKINKLKKDYNL